MVNADYDLVEIGASDDVGITFSESNRLTEGAVVAQDEAGVAPEDTTTWTVRWYATEGAAQLLRTESGIAASTGTQTVTMTTAEEAASPNYLGHLSTAYRVEIEAVRGVYVSTPYIRELTRAGGSGGAFPLLDILAAQVFDDENAAGDDSNILAIEVFS